ncbi:MAG: hypothetical protein A2V90_01680 [Gammaproteobacteria bacterium RBG_16_57_12]|nr:MAG: hypothetical protein A2V90_01680 [Gammaproteobacteria bacterium RBG_16_57_12]
MLLRKPDGHHGNQILVKIHILYNKDAKRTDCDKKSSLPSGQQSTQEGQGQHAGRAGTVTPGQDMRTM